MEAVHPSAGHSVQERPMDERAIAFFLLATFLGGFTTGLTGFAAGLVASGIWLHIITPMQTAVLIAAYGVVNQAYGIWKVRHALRWRRVMPFVIGGAIGVPLGAYLVTYMNPAHLRFGIGVFLIVYSAYNLVRPSLKPVTSNLPTDVGVGVLNGLLGGLTGLGGVIITIWCQLGGGPKDAQRAVFQPVLFSDEAFWLPDPFPEAADTFPIGKGAEGDTFPKRGSILSQNAKKIRPSASGHNDLSPPTIVIREKKESIGEGNGQNCAKRDSQGSGLFSVEEAESYLTDCEALAAERSPTLSFEYQQLIEIADDACLPESLTERARSLLPPPRYTTDSPPELIQ